MPVCSLMVDDMVESGFYLSLTAQDRRAMEGNPARNVERMPAFFKGRPCEEWFPQAYAFFRSPAIPSEQRLIAKRWIVEHLQNLEYALKPVEWERFPLSRKYYGGLLAGEEMEMEEKKEEGAVGLGLMMKRGPPTDGGPERSEPQEEEEEDKMTGKNKKKEEDEEDDGGFETI